MKISIIIPVYNEEEGIKKVIDDLKVCLPNQEIIVVDDYSTDQTNQIIKNISDIKIITHTRNQGYGASLKSGIREAQGQYIIIIDGDGTYPIDAIPELIKYAEEYDMVSGARQGKNHDARWLYTQRIGKFVLKKIAGYVTQTKIPDINCGLRIFKKETIKKFWNLYPQGFSFTTTSLVAFLSNDYRVKFVPINYHKREGKSTLKPFKSFTAFINLIFKISLFFKPIRVFLPLSISFFLLAIGIAVYSLVWDEIFYDTTVILISAMALQTFFFGLLAEIIVHNRK
ncbi:MAG: glycosyltransferase family 2 protein [Patescibacteria group bacterium]|nr:glycosyltransferase family 2 protein [Patescibacteria group bacterium]